MFVSRHGLIMVSRVILTLNEPQCKLIEQVLDPHSVSGSVSVALLEDLMPNASTSSG